MSHTHPEEAHHVKKGAHIMLKGHPCKIVDTKTSKTGKHGHAKCNITGVDILTDRKYNEVHPGHIILAAFDPSKITYEVSNIEDGEIDCLDEEGNEAQFSLINDTDGGHSDDTLQMHNELREKWDNLGDSEFIKITVTSAPVGEGDNTKMQELVTSYSVEKE